MRPISDPRALPAGATLYHSAFGFAHVEAVGADVVSLTWEREGAHLPTSVRFENLERVYTECPPDGFFHRALRDADGLKRELLDRPAEALVRLLDDLAAPQRLRDVMDWLVGRELFSTKTFVRWWGTSEPLVRADGRLRIDGEWISLAAENGRTDLVQLAPDEVDPDTEDPVEDALEGLVEPDAAEASPAIPFATPRAVHLSDARPPCTSLPEVGRAVAEALADAHAEDRIVHPHVSNTVLHPDGRVTFEPGEAPRSTWAEPPSSAADVREAAVMLIEAFIGRPVPSSVEPADLLPHLRHRLRDLAPSALAPLVSALRSDPLQRPEALDWADQWADVHDAERLRPDAGDDSVTLRTAFDSHIGHAKLLLTQVNQDALWVATRQQHTLAILADGISISDAGRGDQASWLTVRSLSRFWQQVPLDVASERRIAERGLQLANRAICEAALRASGGDLAGRMPMGTTAILALAHGNRVHLSSLGDSRAYLLGPWGISQLTADDNVSGQRFLSWCDGQARSWNSDGHALVRYLGHFDTRYEPAPFAPHHLRLDLRPGERLVLCTDGVTDYLASHEAEVAHRIAELATGNSLADAAIALVAAANRAGGGDNASVVLLEVA